MASEEESKKTENELPDLATCRFGTSAMLSVRYGPQKLMTKLRAHVTLYTYNGAAIFFRNHPYIWSTTVLHDTPH